MFKKYIGKLGKSEAEWVQEVLDMYNGNECAARRAICDAMSEYSKTQRSWANDNYAYKRACANYNSWWARLMRCCLRQTTPAPQRPVPPVRSPFVSAVGAATWATGGRWWYDGLVALGLLGEGENLPSLD